MIKFLARDAETGSIGTYQAAFTVPNLNREEKRVPISSVVLSSQRVPLGDALYTVQQKVAAEAVNPLVYDGQKLIPSVTRVFSRSRDLYVFLQAYERDATTTQPLVAFVSFYRGQREGVRDAAAGGDRRPGREDEGRSAQVQPVGGAAAARPVRLPGHRAGPDGTEGRVLAGAHRAGAVSLQGSRET